MRWYLRYPLSYEHVASCWPNAVYRYTTQEISSVHIILGNTMKSIDVEVQIVTR